jgi:hypothetical protein
MSLDRRGFLTGLAAVTTAGAIPASGAARFPESRRLLIVGPLPPNLSERRLMRRMLVAESWVFDEDGGRQAIAGFGTSALFVRRPQAADLRALQLVGFPDYLPWDRSRMIALGHAARFVAQDASLIRGCRGHKGPIVLQMDASDPFHNPPHTEEFSVPLLAILREAGVV